MGIVGILLVAGTTACSSSKNSNGFTSGPDGGGSGDSSIYPGDGTTSFDGPMLGGGDGGEGDAPGMALGCSGDLQSVVDQNGNVIMACPPSEGCAAGTCIGACAAAAANKGTIGCDFVQATPSFYPTITPPCWAVFLANSWGEAATITVSYGGMSYDVTKFGHIPVAGQPETSWPAVPSTGLPVGQVAVLFISSDPNSTNLTPLTCPVAPAVPMGTAVFTDMTSATGMGQPWHIVTSVPVTAYDILPYGGAKSYLPSAELLLPTTAWGTNYIAVVPLLGAALNGAPPGPQWGQIVAATDNTTVKIVPVVALPSGTNVNAAAQNVVSTYTLNAGQFIQWQDTTEMSGSIISSNNPVGFNGGNGYICYADMTSTGGGCDSAHQQIPPVSALGSEYVAPPYTTRRADLMPESIPYRIVGTVNGTTLTYDPPGISGAPASLGLGQVADFETTLAFTVTSQDKNHPFYVAQRMTGCMVTSGSRPGTDPNGMEGANGCLGDEEFVNIMPPAHYLSKYIFFTDPSYATTNLVFVREKGTTGFQDVTLTCSGTLTGWQPVGSAGKYEITNIDLVRGFTQNGTCNNGPQTAKSNGPFGLMVWGLDSEASYAYPAGGNVAPINTVVIPPTPM